ncbi:MAG: hypothetical protein R3C24_13620 [Cyanobacteriota/Melainabacteria group bacterium]
MTGNSNYALLSLTLSLGSLTDGTATNIPVPEPQYMAPVPSNSKIGNNYKSCVNIPVTAGGVTTRFMFGGIGNTVKIVDHESGVPCHPLPMTSRPSSTEAQQLIKTSASQRRASEPSPAPNQPASSTRYLDREHCPSALTDPCGTHQAPAISTSTLK